jgi:hypothetical protein
MRADPGEMRTKVGYETEHGIPDVSFVSSFVGLEPFSTIVPFQLAKKLK